MRVHHPELEPWWERRMAFPSGGGGGGSSGPGVLLYSNTLSSAGSWNVPVSGAYHDLLVNFYVQSQSGGGSTDSLDVGFNSDVSSLYNATHTITTNTAPGSFTKNTWDYIIAHSAIPTPTLGVNYFAWVQLYIANYTSTTSYKQIKCYCTAAYGVGNGQVNEDTGVGFYGSLNAITSIQAIAGNTPFTFSSGSSMRVYGIT